MGAELADMSAEGIDDCRMSIWKCELEFGDDGVRWEVMNILDTAFDAVVGCGHCGAPQYNSRH